MPAGYTAGSLFLILTFLLARNPPQSLCHGSARTYEIDPESMAFSDRR